MVSRAVVDDNDLGIEWRGAGKRSGNRIKAGGKCMGTVSGADDDRQLQGSPPVSRPNLVFGSVAAVQGPFQKPVDRKQWQGDWDKLDGNVD